MFRYFALLLSVFVANSIQAEEPIRALLVTGGCCHDYARQKLILTKGISARANVVWTVAHQGGTATNSKIPLYEDPNWAEGFDVIVHNECFSDAKDMEWVKGILKPHREGTPAVLIHCAMHCYRTGTDDWFEFVGLQSPGHGPHYSYTVRNQSVNHPVMRGFGVEWATPKGELYHSVKIWPTATPLAVANRQSDDEPQVCIWTNQYREKTRVFGTTIGHYNETMVEPKYLDMLTRGLLWATGRLDDNDIRETSEATDEAIRELGSVSVNSKKVSNQPCCGNGNLAFGAPVKASTEETGRNNFSRNAVDGNLATRWCANGPAPGNWWQVDLGKIEQVRSLRIHWEGNAAYRYQIEGSIDEENWTTLVDAASNKTVEKVVSHRLDATRARFLRVTYLGASTGGWGSFWEFEAYSGDLPEIPKSDPVSSASISDVEAPAGFDVTLFGKPPVVNYPVCLTAAATGEVFVGVDDQGSLGKEVGRGKVIRCIDVDGDGEADQVNTFAEMDHPRGLIYDQGTLWVLHPPYLTAYSDDDRDGVADREKRLITGISTDDVNKRGADHTTNGIRMGIDGWIYIAVGDFGFTDAVGADGTTLSRRGGGIVRIRPDGTEMEIYDWGQRNILDVCIDPYMNIFTRDNTNDGGEWNVRLSHILQSAEYGYPSRFMNFTDEIMHPMADYGGGSGCGGFYLHDLRWPEKYRDALYTCDWGRSEVYLHNLRSNGATFDPHQETFVKIPRPTDIDIDGSGRMYISSWKDGKFAYDGPNIGFVAQLVPTGFVPRPFPELAQLNNDELVNMLRAPGMKYRLHAQREILRRSQPELTFAVSSLIADKDSPLYARVAAIYTWKQLSGEDADAVLIRAAAEDSVLREHCLRALTDRIPQNGDLLAREILPYLKDENPRVVAQAIISLGRLGDSSAADAILPLTIRQDGARPVAHNVAAPGKVIPHLAVRALVALSAGDVCLSGLDTPYRSGAIQALRSLHSREVVNGLVSRLNETEDVSEKGDLLSILIRLYHREGAYQGGWWGTRPDRTGPYYDRKTWEQSEQVGTVIVSHFQHADELLRDRLINELVRHRVQLKGLPEEIFNGSTQSEPDQPIVIPGVDPNNPNQIANMSFETAFRKVMMLSGKPKQGRKIFLQQSCSACHTWLNGQPPKGPHLVDVGKRYKKEELVESILKPSAKIAQGFDSYSFVTTQGKIYSGFVVGESAEDLTLRQTDGLSQTLVKNDIEERVKREESMMPKGIADNLTPEELAHLLAFLQQLK